ncbi:MAG TPA: septal ring lytic transglycosylase RlpA family protein [Flavobacterium sp.]|nr:septal ring lytic transglycosylase RlpA family protein [Flavobacterium sp.]
MKSTLLILCSFIGLLASFEHRSEKPFSYVMEQDSLQRNKNQKPKLVDKTKLSDSISKFYTNLILEVEQDSLSGRLKSYKTQVTVSYYADKFNGRRTASGQVYDNKKYTAAHKTLPFGARLRVTNLSNNKSVLVVVNDRGPFSKGKELDLSKAAFIEVAENIRSGVISAKIEVVE